MGDATRARVPAQASPPPKHRAGRAGPMPISGTLTAVAGSCAEWMALARTC